MSTDTTEKIAHNIRLLRNLRGRKQETMATELGISAEKYCSIEQFGVMEENMLAQIAKVLEVPPEMIIEFDTKALLSSVLSKIDGTDFQINAEEIEMNNAWEKIFELYGRLLTSERDKLEILKCFNDQVDN